MNGKSHQAILIHRRWVVLTATLDFTVSGTVEKSRVTADASLGQL